METAEFTEFLATHNGSAEFSRLRGEIRVFVSIPPGEDSELGFSAMAGNLRDAVAAVKRDYERYMARRNWIMPGARRKKPVEPPPPEPEPEPEPIPEPELPVEEPPVFVIEEEKVEEIPPSPPEPEPHPSPPPPPVEEKPKKAKGQTKPKKTTRSKKK